MKIKRFFPVVLLLIFPLVFHGEINAGDISELQKKFLHNHFEDKKYEVWNEKLIAENKVFTTAVHYVDRKNRIIDDAVVFSVIEFQIVPYLYFKPDRILDGNKVPIIDISIHPYNFYGWGLEYSYPKNNNFSPGFATISFADSGKRVTDGPTIQWNSQRNSFEAVVFDNM